MIDMISIGILRRAKHFKVRLQVWTAVTLFIMMTLLLYMLPAPYLDSEQQLKIMRPAFGVLLFSVVLFLSPLVSVANHLLDFCVRVLVLPLLVLVLLATILMAVEKQLLLYDLVLRSPIFACCLFLPSLIVYFLVRNRGEQKSIIEQFPSLEQKPILSSIKHFKTQLCVALILFTAMTLLLSLLDFESEQQLKIIRPAFGIMLFSVVLFFSPLVSVTNNLLNFYVQVLTLPPLVFASSAMLLMSVGKEDLLDDLLFHSPMLILTLLLSSLILYFFMSKKG